MIESIPVTAHVNITLTFSPPNDKVEWQSAYKKSVVLLHRKLNGLIHLQLDASAFRRVQLNDHFLDI